MKANRMPPFSAKIFLAKAGTGRAVKRHTKGNVIFSQADPADALFYIQKGKVNLTVVSNRGKQAVIAIFGTGDFFGEGCLAGQLVHGQSCRHGRLLAGADGEGRRDHSGSRPAGLFRALPAYVLSRNIRIEEDLVDQLFKFQ